MATGEAIQEAFNGVSAKDPLVVLAFAFARAKVGAREWMRLCSCVAHVSQRLHIGANYIADPADFGVAVDFIDAGLFLAKKSFRASMRYRVRFCSEI